jgi:hypothetical protein
VLVTKAKVTVIAHSGTEKDGDVVMEAEVEIETGAEIEIEMEEDVVETGTEEEK